MMKLNLQQFAEKNAVEGKKLVYLYSVLSKAASKAGATLAFTKENNKSKSKDFDSTPTKDGNIRTPGTAEIEITATSYLSVGDDLISELEEAMDNNGQIEIWEANLQEAATGGQNKFKGVYYRGYLTEIEYSSDSEDFVEVSLKFAIEGNGAKGDVTVTTEQQDLANYVFEDTSKKGA